MSFWEDIGAVAGGLAGAPAGIFGMLGGGKAGSWLGGQAGGLFGSGKGSFDPYGGMPGNYPSYIGMEPQGFADRFAGPNMPLQKYAGDAMRTGPSVSTKFALDQNAINTGMGREQARKLASGMAATGESNLAMKGGIGAGARERIQKYATDVGMDAAQRAEAAGGANRSNLMIADENARMGNLATAAGLVGSDARDKYTMFSGDEGRKQQELTRKNLYNMNLYNKQMEAWAAGKQADATANSGKDGLFK